MRRTASTSLRSLSVPLPFRAIHTNTKPHSRWRLPWSLDSTMYCRSADTKHDRPRHAQAGFVNPCGHRAGADGARHRRGRRAGAAAIGTGRPAAATPRPHPGRGRDPRWLVPELPHPGTPVTLTNQAVACKSDPAPVTGHVKTVEILVDRTSIETFVNEGEVSLGVLPPRRRPARACQRPGAGTHPLPPRIRDQVDMGRELRIAHFSLIVVRDDHEFDSTACSHCRQRDSSRVFSSPWRSSLFTALSASP